jgi:hypothetical protein
MRERTIRRKLTARISRLASPFAGDLCESCGHYARRVRVRGRLQLICNANDIHKVSRLGV